ncbi:MAG: class I tRNA ligase family protein, partial [Chloroflexi bacterium]|nr:class I tRNA ligase family protein [Chloroflexota bacterium]
MYQEVPSKVDFPALERDIMAFWAEVKAFETRRALNAGHEPWSFIDGPITANNPMAVHHAWGRTYKDLFHRFKAMQGYDTRYQNGFDCQGLWVEVEVEKEMGFKTKRDIEAYGLADFVLRCKERVLRYSAVQTEQSVRLGYWMDWNDPDTLRFLADKLAKDPDQVITVDGPNGPVTNTVEYIVGHLGMPEMGGSYYTFADENNYTIWSMLKTCHERGWVYQGTDVMPWCPRCGTGISQHEIVTDGYRELTHASVTLRFPLRERSDDTVRRQRESLLVWTTTPWTLTSNVAAAVHPDLPYVQVRQGEHVLYLSKGTLPVLQGPYEVLGELPGREMEGWTYDGPFDELSIQQSTGSAAAHRVILWDEVSEEEGTGIVHIAPGCGAEDFLLGKEFGLPALAPLDEAGIFGAGYDWLTGMNVSDVAQPIFANLREKGVLYDVSDYTHRYPVCWRCETELVFRLVDEWFISMGAQLDKPLEEVTPQEKVTNLRYQIMDVVKDIRWVPDFGQAREMDWLRNMHDWMISKKRYWGLALPIWACECGWFDVIGSQEELRERAVEGWDAFEGHTPHRPYIDAVKVRCSQCGRLVSRIADVGNPWLDAGIVALSTVRYNSDRAYWEKWFPADLISETFLLQFRNWFYSLLTMSVVMTGKAPFESVFTYAVLLAEDGRQMHKSWGNAIWFEDAAEKMGVDVMRWLFCAHKEEHNLMFGYGRADETRRRFILPLWNVYSFFVTYARLDEWTPAQTAGQPVELTELDRWVLSRLQVLIRDVTACLDELNPYAATGHAERFVDDLSNWYVRRSRRRFWKSESDADKLAAYATLHRVLLTLAELLAPFIPFLTEAMYQNLVRSVDETAPVSVHHRDWPTPDEALIDEDLMQAMDLALKAVSLGHSARNTAGLKLRQPLAEAVVFAKSDADRAALARMADVIQDELNVKALRWAESPDELVSYVVRPVLPKLGPKYGKRVPAIRATLEALDPADVARRVGAGVPVELDVTGGVVTLEPDEVEVSTVQREGYAVATEGDPSTGSGQALTVGVDTVLTEALQLEGLARDLVRAIQEMRKAAGFDIADRIVAHYQG